MVASLDGLAPINSRSSLLISSVPLASSTLDSQQGLGEGGSSALKAGEAT